MRKTDMKPEYIEAHPVLGPLAPREEVTFYYNGAPVAAHAGDTVAGALYACGVRVFGHTHKRGAPRGVFCSIGHCTDCMMTVDGADNVRTCITPVKEGMRVESSRV